MGQTSTQTGAEDIDGQDVGRQDVGGQDIDGQDAGREDVDDAQPVDPAAASESGGHADPDAASGRRGTALPAGRFEELEQEGEVAADYLEGFLDIADLDGDIDMDVEGDRAAVSIVGRGLKQLIGKDGAVLEAVQELTRMAVHRETGTRSRLMLDIGGYRSERRAALTDEGRRAAQKATATGRAVTLAPMTPFERKVVHDAVAAAGLRSESEGAEPDRCVVVHPE